MLFAFIFNYIYRGKDKVIDLIQDLECRSLKWIPKFKYLVELISVLG